MSCWQESPSVVYILFDVYEFKILGYDAFVWRQFRFIISRNDPSFHPPMVAFKSSPTFVVPRKRNGREGEIRHS